MCRQRVVPISALQLLIGFLCCLAGAVFSYTQAMETVTVLGSRRDATRGDLPHSITVLNQDDIQAKFARSLPDAFTQSPGVMIQKSANGQGAPYLRGFTGYRTLTLIDGVRYNNSVYRDGPNEYFSLIDYNAVDSVEIFGGPGSVLYGSDAIGGTVFIRSRRADHERERSGEVFLHGLQRVSVASVDNSRQSRTEVQAGRGKHWGMHAGYSLKHFGNLETADLGKQPFTGYGERAFDIRFDTDINAQWELTAAYQELDQDDVWRTFATQFAQPFAGTSVGRDLRRVKDQHRSLAYLRLAGDQLNPLIDGFNLTLSRQGWHETGDRQRADASRRVESFRSTMLGLDIQFDSQAGPIDLIYGIDYYRDSVVSAGRDFAANGQLTQIRIQGPVGDDARFAQRGAYVEGVWNLQSRWRLQFGTRYTRVSATIGRFEDPRTQSAARFSDTWGELVSSFRANWAVSEQHALWLGISQAFRAPNVADLSRFGASRSNETEIAATDLEPERFVTGELGLRHHSERTALAATVYHTRIRDFITSTPTGRLNAGMIEVSKRNSADGYVQGIELSASRKLAAGFSLWSNLTWLEGRLNTIGSLVDPTERREAFSRIMPLSFNGGVQWQAADGGWRAALDLTLADRADKLSRGDRADTQRIPPGGTPGYEVVNFSLRKRLGKYLAADLGVTNLFDARYRSHGSGVNAGGIGFDLRLTAQF